MDLPALFSLLFAAIITLFPLLLLMGRRMSRRPGAEEPGTDQQGAEERKPPGGAPDSAGPALGRLGERLKGSGRDTRPKAREIYTRGQRPSAERDLRDAARIAGVQRPVRPSKPAALSTATPAATRKPGSGVLLQERLARLSPLQRAVVYAEILGKPASLREPGRREAL